MRIRAELRLENTAVRSRDATEEYRQKEDNGESRLCDQCLNSEHNGDVTRQEVRRVPNCRAYRVHFRQQLNDGDIWLDL